MVFPESRQIPDIKRPDMQPDIRPVGASLLKQCCGAGAGAGAGGAEIILRSRNRSRN